MSKVDRHKSPRNQGKQRRLMAVVLGVGYGADAPGAALGEVEGVGYCQ